EELAVLPVLAIGGGGHRDDGDRADLRGKERETGRPPRDAPAGKKENPRGLLLAAEDAAAQDEGGQRRPHDGEVGPRECGSSGLGHGLAPLWPTPAGSSKNYAPAFCRICFSRSANEPRWRDA